jgi:hypothetical protein
MKMRIAGLVLGLIFATVIISAYAVTSASHPGTTTVSTPKTTTPTGITFLDYLSHTFVNSSTVQIVTRFNGVIDNGFSISIIGPTGTTYTPTFTYSVSGSNLTVTANISPATFSSGYAYTVDYTDVQVFSIQITK